MAKSSASPRSTPRRGTQSNLSSQQSPVWPGDGKSSAFVPWTSTTLPSAPRTQKEVRTTATTEWQMALFPYGGFPSASSRSHHRLPRIPYVAPAGQPRTGGGQGQAAGSFRRTYTRCAVIRHAATSPTRLPPITRTGCTGSTPAPSSMPAPAQSSPRRAARSSASRLRTSCRGQQKTPCGHHTATAVPHSHGAMSPQASGSPERLTVAA